MPHFVCVACGAQYADAPEPPAVCAICADERQFVPPSGQEWTTHDALKTGHANVIERVEPGLYSVGVTPAFAIGQRALLVTTDEGNLLWDCVPVLDDAAVELLEGLGGVDAIAISHPHYYSACVEWSRAFGDAPVHLHGADAAWVTRPDPCIRHWNGNGLELWGGLRVVRTGGHFPGSSVLHWPDGAGGRGALLVGDTLKVTATRRGVSVQYSYPNDIPLPRGALLTVQRRLKGLAYGRVVGAWRDHVIDGDAKACVDRSLERLLQVFDQ